MSKRNRVIALLLIIILFVACTSGAKNKAPQKDAVVETVPTKGKKFLPMKKQLKLRKKRLPMLKVKMMKTTRANC